MKKDDIVTCNVCLRRSDEDKVAVFIEAFKNGQNVHICTACIPQVIHGSGEVVRSNEDAQR